MPTEMTSLEVAALRFCAATCWQRREELGLSPEQTEQVLLAWLTIGNAAEGEAAAAALAALRFAQAKQLEFSALLTGGPKS